LSRRVPVTLATHVRNRAALEQAGAPLAGSQVIYIDTEWFAGPVYRIASWIFPRSQHAVFLLSSVDFYVYDRQLLRTLRRRPHPGGELVHVVTPVSPMAASVMHRLGLPVVMGPWNGGLATPAAFADLMREDSAWFYRIRKLGRLLDGLTGSTRHAGMILTATRSTDECLPAGSRGRVVRMLENGVDLDRFVPAPWPALPGLDQPLRVLFAGRLVPFKGVPLLLEAVARIRCEFPMEVSILGDGPVAGDCRLQAQALGLDGIVRFLGQQPLSEVPEQMRAAHVFCLPSVRESGGAVLLEAMACARPVIAVGYGGPAEIVDQEVGCLLPPDGPEPVIAGLAEAFRDIVRDPQKWRRRGEAGRHRAEQEYGWDAKIETALGLYEKLLAGGRPE
jgi:glycosyltransferase involved in cell wall biosynthesis